MKKSTLLLVLIALTMQVSAQEFAPLGAIWHYTQGTINPYVTSYKTLESVADTAINGVACKKIVEIERYIDTIQVTFQYMYSENDSVFFFKDGGFHLLYDFGAEAGDTIILDYFMNLEMIIDSTGTIMVNDQERKIQYITSSNGLVFEFGDQIIEGIGSTSFMFPTTDGDLDGPLRCYEDENTGLYINPFHPNSGWNHENCEEIITDVKENSGSESILIYPNPVSGIIRIENIDPMTNCRIVNVKGETLIKRNISESNEFNLTALPKGIFFIELKNKDYMTVNKIIKK